MTDQLLENTILLFVAVDPIALIPIFASLTKGLKNQEIKKIYIQATFVSLIMIGWNIFAIIGVFKAADIYKYEMIKIGHSYGYATAAKIAVVILILSAIGRAI